MSQPSLTRLQFKNWRSLRDVEIEFDTPITVFIGANSSGKTNIVDGLRFRRDALRKSLLRVVGDMGYRKIQTNAPENTEDVVLAFTYKLPSQNGAIQTIDPIREEISLHFEKRNIPFWASNKLYEGDTLREDIPLRELPPKEEVTVSTRTDEDKQREEYAEKLRIDPYDFVQHRWQILGDSFVPPERLSQHEGGESYLIEQDARNMLNVLYFMRETQPELFRLLEQDLHWTLDHVTSIGLVSNADRELELYIREQQGKVAPTISTGTLRVLATLTAFYALDMPQEIISFGRTVKILRSEIPGLVVIEEPDTALNPGILARFVGQLREYTREKPRQIILTTHNPTFLNYFEPEEVRVVTRDEQGYTQVERVPDYVRELWLDEFKLGEVWVSNSFGALAE